MNANASSLHAANRRMRLMVVVHAFWLAVVFLLGAWWGKLVLQQAEKIAELERKLGIGAAAHEQWERTQRMLLWESAVFFVLLLASTALLAWLYWRDLRRNRAIEAFFASVTHELRTPLTSIRLQAESIAESVPSPEAAPLLRRLLEDTMRLEGQVERTLELARVEGGGPIFVQPLELKPWLDRLIQGWRQNFTGRAEIMSSIEDLTAEADPTALGIVLKNLLENSLKHSRREPVRVTIDVRPRGGWIELSFRDDGEGFRGESRYLGEIFHRGPHSQGSGVGLYLVRVLTERMGGHARFRGGSGFETTLWLKEGRSSG